MDAAIGHRLVRRLGPVRYAALTSLGLFAGTLFLSALLLFSVQPMFAKMVLPKLGGSPSVWAVSMCFFQAALLAGYCYAHALNRYAPSKLAPLIHLGVLGLAVLALPIGLPASGAEPPAGDAYLWLIGVLALGVGLPSSSYRPTHRCCRPGSPARAIRMPTIRTSYMARRTSAA